MIITINADTKISAILKQNPAALEAIISINSKLEKLRNPLLRKLMAGRTSIGMASKISGSSPEDFYTKLEPLGFKIDKIKSGDTNEDRPRLPAFFNELKPGQVIELDVRLIIDANEDPLSLIIKKVKSILPGQTLKIVNSFEPTPLILLLKKQGFESYVDVVNNNLVATYFYKKDDSKISIEQAEDKNEDWDKCLERFQNKIQILDVRGLEMPGPMLNILQAIENLSYETALFVYHKRIPVFLLPELKERNFDFRIKEVSDNEVHLLIFKD